MKKGLGIRPVPAQRNLPENQVTEWILDSNGEYDEEGRALPRRRIRFDGSRPKALAQRRSWLVRLAAEMEPATSRAQTNTPILTATLASVAADASQVSIVPKPTALASRRTFADFARKEYLEQSLRSHDETTTPERMRLLERRVLPVVGDLVLEEANNYGTVDKLRESLDSIVIEKTGQKLKGNTKNQALLAFSHVLTVATRRQLIPAKVTVELYADKNIEPGQMMVKEHGFVCGVSRHKRYPDEDVRKILAACQDDYDFALVGLGLFLACRPAEMPARLWTDVVWDSSQVKIWSQVAWKRATQEYYIKKYPKNGVGGILSVSAEFLQVLERLRRKSTREYILTPNDYDRRDFLSKAALRHRFMLIAQRAGLTRPAYIHGLRHTFCCQHADNGLPAHEIQKLARHKSIATTYEYIDPSTERLKQAVLSAESFKTRR